MNLDLQRMLELTRRGQWSVDDIDWSTPTQGISKLTKRERREAGRALLFTAGLERQAAKVFRLCAEFVDDPNAAEIYKLFYEDEMRHAAAEEKLAERYGVAKGDLPLGVRTMFRALENDFERSTRSGNMIGLHEISSATILLFELALDSILIPSLKSLSEDPIQAEVFQRIDSDESRHLAMDYWLLERKGLAQKGKSFADLMEEHYGPPSLPQKLLARLSLYGAFGIFALGFGSMALRTRSIRDELMSPAKVEKYLERVGKVTKRAPHALDVPAYRMGLKSQNYILEIMGRIANRRSPAPQGGASA